MSQNYYSFLMQKPTIFHYITLQNHYTGTDQPVVALPLNARSETDNSLFQSLGCLPE